MFVIKGKEMGIEDIVNVSRGNEEIQVVLEAMEAIYLAVSNREILAVEIETGGLE